MAATLSAGVNSLILRLDTPYDTIRTTDIRDDLIKVKVWCSATPNFTPVDTGSAGANQVFDGLSLSITISEIPTIPTPTKLVAGTVYYVRYAFISDIQEDVYTISSELVGTPVSATSQSVEISGYAGFSKTVLGVFNPLNANLTAVVSGINNPVYAWTVTGATAPVTNTSTITITPSLNANSITVTVSVTGSNLLIAIAKTIVMPIILNGPPGNSVFVATVYQQSQNDPGSPSATTSSYNFNTNTLVGPGSGWLTVQPATTTTPTWACDYTFVGAPTETVTGIGNWGPTYIEAVNGTNGEYRDIIELYLASESPPTKPTSVAYTFSTNTAVVTGGSAGWSLTQPATTTIPTYIVKSLATTSTPTIAVTLTTWTTPLIVAQNGAKGDTGTSIEVQYSDNGTTGWSTTPTSGTKWIRINTITNGITTEGIAKKYIPTLGVEYTVTNGTSSYVHIKYSNDGGSTFTTSNGEDPGTYIGIYTDATIADSNNPADYTWTRIKGEPGINGTGLQVEYSPNGVNGWVSTPTISSKYIRVNTVAANGTITLGVAQKYIPEVGIDYTVTNGQTSYLHIKYSNNGGVTFTGLNGETTGDYIGTLTDFNPVDSSNPGDYTWAKIKGEPGTGTVGASNHRAYRAYTTTSPPTSPPENTTNGAAPAGWSLIPVSVAVGQAQYQTDGTTTAGSTTTTWTTPYLSYFKVANLEAITASTGNLNVTGTITVDNDATGSVVIDNGSIRIFNGTSLRVKLGRL
jgi:hypothetical protein